VLGAKRFFFAVRPGRKASSPTQNWTMVGHLYKDGIKAVRKDPERYIHNRSGPSPAPTWVHGNYPDPTDDDCERQTVNIDPPGIS
jgi:hypothetical protein